MFDQNPPGMQSRPLNILIVGAGIGGLTAALGLRKNGHNVTVYEQSRLATEFGAAVMLSPNAHRIFKRFELDAIKDGAVLAERFKFHASTGSLLQTMEVAKAFLTYRAPPILCRRVALHTSLKNAALSPDGEGPAVKLVTGARIVDLDVETCTVFLGDGEKAAGDLIIGADGVKSVTRTKVHGNKPFPSGKSAYRFIVERQKALQSPLAAEISQGDGEFSAWHGRDRRMWFYTTHYNELLNVVCIHPDSLSQPPSNTSDAFGGLENRVEDNKANMLKIYEGFDPRVLALLELAEPSSVRLWQLLDMDPPPTRLVGGRLCLLGDAALPILPYVGQGAALAIEDAASLAALLLPGISLSVIPERLLIYEQCRKERTEILHGLSRTMGRDMIEENGEKVNIAEGNEKARIDMGRYVYAHDEYDHTTQKLREHLWRKEELHWSMPTIFGPIPASRSNFHSVSVDESRYKYTRLCVKFKTSRSLLENLLPRKFLSFVVLGDFANASFVHTKRLNVSWLGGQSYSELAFYIHDVQAVQSNGSILSGSFLAIVFVNSPDAITSDREALGIPKVFCDLEITPEIKDFKVDDLGESSSYSLRASWQGLCFMEIQVQDLVAIKTAEEGHDDSDPIFTHRYIPALGNKGKPLADSIVCLSSALPQSVKRLEMRMAAGSKADIKWNGCDEYTLPTLHPIISRLSELAVLEVVEATAAWGDGGPPTYEDAYVV